MKEKKIFLIPNAEIIHFEGDGIDCLVESGLDEIGGVSYKDLP